MYKACTYSFVYINHLQYKVCTKFHLFILNIVLNHHPLNSLFGDFLTQMGCELIIFPIFLNLVFGTGGEANNSSSCPLLVDVVFFFPRPLKYKSFSFIRPIIRATSG